MINYKARLSAEDGVDGSDDVDGSVVVLLGEVRLDGFLHLPRVRHERTQLWLKPQRLPLSSRVVVDVTVSPPVIRLGTK